MSLVMNMRNGTQISVPKKYPTMIFLEKSIFMVFAANRPRFFKMLRKILTFLINQIQIQVHSSLQ